MSAVISDQAQFRVLTILLPEAAGDGGALHGANALQIMGKAAFICAARHARCAVVMAKADNIEFTRPVRNDAIVDVRASVVFQGRSSMTVLVGIMAGNFTSRPAEPSISGRFMMVAVDAGGVPMPIPSHADQPQVEEAVS
jgi:acyl-CoA hydrolase